MIKLAFLRNWIAVKKLQMIFYSRNQASRITSAISLSSRPVLSPLTRPSQNSDFNEQRKCQTVMNSFLWTLSIYYAAQLSFSFIKWSRGAKSLSNHLDWRDPPLEIDESQLQLQLCAMEMQDLVCFVLPPLSSPQINE